MTDKQLKWLMWSLVAAILFFGGFALRLQLVDDHVRTKAYITLRLMSSMGMIFGMLLFGTLLILFVIKNLNK